jgi:hypothetical protein
MKLITCALPLLMVGPLFAYQPYLVSSTISLTSTSTTTMLNRTGSGVVVALACIVDNSGGISGSPAFHVGFSLDNAGETEFNVYSTANTWSTNISPWWSPSVDTVTYGNILGTNWGNSFILPLTNMTYSTDVTVKAYVTGAGTAGTLVCNLIHGH